MAKISIDCDIRSEDSKSVFQTEGTLEHNVMTFQDPSGDTHVLTFQSPRLMYQKNGSTTMKFSFDPTMDTIGTYQVMGQTMSFTIHTNTYEHQHGMIRLSYHLIQDNETVGHTLLSIDYRHKEE